MLTRLGIGGSSGSYVGFLPKSAGVVIVPPTPSSGLGRNRKIGFESSNRNSLFKGNNRILGMKRVKRKIGFKS